MADLTDRLRAALTVAMRSRDRDGVTALRTALGAIDNASAVDPGESGPAVADGPIAGAASGVGATEAARRELTDADVAAIVEAEIAERDAAATDYERAGRVDGAIHLRAEAAALRAVLAGDTPAT